MAKKKPEDEDQIVTYHGQTERHFLPGIEAQSLVESIRGSLPQDEFPQQLVFLSVNQPGLYSTFLGKLISGSSFRSAALACGLSHRHMNSWIKQGANDLAEELDTYCSRLLLDCQRAACLAITNAEERVHQQDPSKWLTRGPGKLFFKNEIWTEEKPGTRLTAEGQASIEDPLDPQPEQELIEDQTQKAEEAGRADLAEAIKVLEDHQIVNNAEFFKHAREQYNIKTEENK